MIVLNGIFMALAILIGTICIVVIAWGYRLSWREGNCHAHFRLHKWSETEEAIQYGHWAQERTSWTRYSRHCLRCPARQTWED